MMLPPASGTPCVSENVSTLPPTRSRPSRTSDFVTGPLQLERGHQARQAGTDRRSTSAESSGRPRARPGGQRGQSGGGRGSAQEFSAGLWASSVGRISGGRAAYFTRASADATSTYFYLRVSRQRSSTGPTARIMHSCHDRAPVPCLRIPASTIARAAAAPPARCAAGSTISSNSCTPTWSTAPMRA